MAEVCTHSKWLMMHLSGKVWVYCDTCAARFQFTAECDGARYHGPLPERYTNEK